MTGFVIAIFLLVVASFGFSLYLDLKRYEAIKRIEEEELQQKLYAEEKLAEAPKRKRGRPRKTEAA